MFTDGNNYLQSLIMKSSDYLFKDRTVKQLINDSYCQNR